MAKESNPKPSDSREPAGGFEKNLENNQPDPLTCIRDAYTLAYTKDDGSDVDKLMVKNFNEVLAEVALAAAARKTGH